MSFYVFIYTVSILLSLTCWVLVFQKFKNLSGLFFLLFTTFASTWFLLYFLFFVWIENSNLLLNISRLGFGIWVGATYSLLFFIYFFDSKHSSVLDRRIFFIFPVYFAILFFHIGTDSVVVSLAYDPVDKVYREIQWKYYLVNTILHLVGVLLIPLASWTRLKQQSYINRMRLQRIMSGAFLFMLFALLLQMVLPTFWIWILEKELVLLFLLFTLYTFHTLQKYYSPSGYRFGKIVVFFFSTTCSILVLNVVKWGMASFTSSSNVLMNYWNYTDSYSIIDTTLWILLFFGVFTVLRKRFLWESRKLELKNDVDRIQEEIVRIVDLDALNDYLSRMIRAIFKADSGRIELYSRLDDTSALRSYFESGAPEWILINDIVFLEENSEYLDSWKIRLEIPSDAFLLLPLYHTNGKANIGYLVIGSKPFGDFFTTDEIEVLRNLAFFIESHLRYLETYAALQDLTVNLDRKVDDKTIEYNDLINRQKEFISVISHEIKAPIANAIFQADSIVDDLDSWKLSKAEIRTEIEVLNGELIKSGELISKLFSLQYFDTRPVSLFRERVRVEQILQSEIDLFSRMHENVRFISEIEPKIGFVEIDRIQFQQVITNLLSNAVKFLEGEKSDIIVEACRKDGCLHVAIEDSGKGFTGIDMTRLFDRYSTWEWKSIWLGMGLYLCKKIIEMHGWEIWASSGERFWWARFSIRIPTEQS